MWELILMAAGVASSVIQAKHEMKVQDINIEREKVAAESRADDRRAELRKQLAAARVAMIGQGSTLQSGDAAVNKRMSLLGYLRDNTRDRFSTEGTLASMENARLSSAFNGVTGASNSLLSYGKSKKQQDTGVSGSGSSSPTGSNNWRNDSWN